MFDHYILLGSGCSMAASMSKYGLRSFSGPFDWLITSDLGWVLHYIETDFRDFLLQENLERYDEYLHHFRDRQSGFLFIHETANFETDYGRLKEKYDRRVSRFLEKIKSRTCYLRAILNEDMLKYVENNSDYIRDVVKKHNRDSEIVFLCRKNLTIPDGFAFRYYIMPGTWGGVSRAVLRSYFDGAYDFLDFAGENYSARELIRNLRVDLEKEEPGLLLDQRRYITLKTLLAHDFSEDIVSDQVIIYGAGNIGTELYKKIKGLTSVICFVDQEKAGGSVENVKIISPDEVICENGAKMIVSAAFDFENIKKNLSGKFRDEDIISLDDILNLHF